MRHAAFALTLPALALAACSPSESEDAAPESAVTEEGSPAAELAEGPREAGEAAEPAASSSRGPTSAYSDLDLDQCTVIEDATEYESVIWRCAGFGGIPLIVGLGDGRYDVDAGVDNGNFGTMGAFNNPGDKVEWRLDGGKPFAIIYRLNDATSEIGGQGGSFLVVETIGSAGKPGCEVARVDGATRDANARARQLADELARNFACGSDEPVMVGKRTG